MAAGFPVKANYATGDILTATNMNDLAGTLNYLDPTAKGDLFPASDGSTLTRLPVGADYGFLQADAAQSVGIKWNSGAWTSYTPTITSTTGTLTTATASGAYIRIGKLCAVRQVWTVTTNGTGAGQIDLSIPFTSISSAVQIGFGRETGATGNQLQVEIPANTTTARYRTYNNLYPAGNGYSGVGSFIYEVA